MIRHRHANRWLWILGSLLAGNAAFSDPPATPAPSSPAAAAVPLAAAPPPARAAAGGGTAPQVATVARAPLPAGQVWQCVIDGERIFSDAPCGEHASIRQLRELNIMAAPPPRSYPYSYPDAPSAPVPTFATAQPDNSDDADAWGPDVLWVHGYARRNYFPRQDNHIRPQPQAHPHPHRGRN